VPLDPGLAIVVCDSGVRRENARSDYNLRWAECKRGVELLRAVLPSITALRDVDVSRLPLIESELPDPIRKRCRHVVTENHRTERAAALRVGDRRALGRLLASSHRSLRDDYEVSCRELDALVEIGGRIPGCFGSRMTGVGFGGCTVHFVAVGEVAGFQQAVAREFERSFGRFPKIFATWAGGGARELEREVP
jgi:galactokinase